MEEIHRSVVRVSIEIGRDDKGGWHWHLAGDPDWNDAGYYVSGAPAMVPHDVVPMHGSAQEAAEKAVALQLAAPPP